MKNFTVGNTVKIYRRCRKAVQGRIFTEGNIVLKFLVEEGICAEDAEYYLRGDIEFEKLVEFC